uniref:Uncharacterized protein n=1 Tax=Physcomitrium patens TaxID=3218 RepID=A0A2K1JKH3_PHYPA|nr:hypothetical protein PHYPA_016882 [Physcomitrium patens]
MATSASCVKKAQMKESDETEKRSEVVAVAPPCSLFPRIPSLQSNAMSRASRISPSHREKPARCCTFRWETRTTGWKSNHQVMIFRFCYDEGFRVENSIRGLCPEVANKE